MLNLDQQNKSTLNPWRSIIQTEHQSSNAEKLIRNFEQRLSSINSHVKHDFKIVISIKPKNFPDLKFPVIKPETPCALPYAADFFDRQCEFLMNKNLIPTSLNYLPFK